MNRPEIKFMWVALIVWALTFFAVLSFPAQASPVVAPRAEVFLLNDDLITTTTTWAGPAAIGEHENIDVFYSIDQTDINTLTLTLQVSPDNATWFSHSTDSAVVANNAADATAHVTGATEGIYYRVTTTNGNTSEVTPTVWIVLR